MSTKTVVIIEVVLDKAKYDKQPRIDCKLGFIDNVEITRIIEKNLSIKDCSNIVELQSQDLAQLAFDESNGVFPGNKIIDVLKLEICREALKLGLSYLETEDLKYPDVLLLTTFDKTMYQIISNK